MIEIKRVENSSELELNFQIRRQVFVDEMGMFAKDEYDQHDKERKCRYYLAYYNNIPVGAARWRESGSGYKIERMCVLKDHRGLGLGDAMTKKILVDIPKNLQLTLGCPTETMGFYEKYGFKSREKPYWESNVLYNHMKLYTDMKN